MKRNEHTPERSDAAAKTDDAELLRQSRVPAPDDFVERVMAALPAEPEPTWRALLRRAWPDRGRWLLPAAAGAVAALIVLVLAQVAVQGPADRDAVVHFQLHAPGASQVELVGSFTGWSQGRIALEGPDSAGHWTATVRLPEGRHEYLFLVDGSEWVTDPDALVRRPDGFGRVNAVLDVEGQDT